MPVQCMSHVGISLSYLSNPGHPVVKYACRFVYLRLPASSPSTAVHVHIESTLQQVESLLCWR